MATKQLPMRKIRDILRLKWTLQASHRAIAKSLGISVGAVGTVASRAKRAELSWEAVCKMDEAELKERLYGRGSRAPERPEPDWALLDIELRKAGVTLELLHVEYLKEHPEGYRYTAFCKHYRDWKKKRRLSMRQEHRGGEKLFVDYAGKTLSIIEPATGQGRPVALFVAVLGASNYTYAEATWSQQSADWIGSHVRALEYMGGVPRVIVPDQLKSGVSRACRYEPEVQRTYEEMASHYGTAIVPARVRKPKDKAKVEVGVQVVERWIVARLRHERFFSLGELNGRIAQLVEELNQRPMRSYGGVSRGALYERVDRDALRPLPPERFVYGTWKLARVNIDYHVEVQRHYYSVHYTLVGEQVEVRVSAQTVEVFHRGKRVASHCRVDAPGRHTTNAAHMPKAHQKHLEWTPSRLMSWASSVGANVARLVEAIIQERPHPEQGYRSCLGILRLQKRYGNERLDAACLRALRVGARSYRSVATILEHGLDRMPLEEDAPATAVPSSHQNLRGSGYYH